MISFTPRTNDSMFNVDDDFDDDDDDDDDDLPMNWVCGIECSLRNDEANGGQYRSDIDPDPVPT